MAQLKGPGPEPVKRKIQIAFSADKRTAVLSAREMAKNAGFERKAVEEVGLVVSELASNIIRHAGGGELRLQVMAQADRMGIEIVAVDQGPGIKNLSMVFADGYSGDQGLGYGLGTVNRLMDEMDIQPGAIRGAKVTCRKWFLRNPAGAAPRPLTFGVATRPKPGSKVNGDAFVLKSWGQESLVAVIDGLGHGQFAHRASNKARNYIENHFDQSFPNIFLGVGRECLTTRGVVMALARFDWRQGQITYASVGNIEARLFDAPQDLKFAIRRGILGLNAPKPLVNRHPWSPSYTLVMHSDGLRTHWSPKQFPGFDDMSAQQAAKTLLDSLAKDNDDATVVVVKEAKA